MEATSADETSISTVAATDRTNDGKALALSAAMQETTIAELTPTSYDKILEARVYKKWVAVTYLKNGTKKETAFCCILIDREGNAIQCNMNIREKNFFDPKIRLGSVYRISDFVCEPTDPYQQTIDNKTSIRFGRITKFEPSTATNIPYHYFNFTSYNQLQSRIPTENAYGQMEYPILTDYMGCLSSVGELKRKLSSNGDQIIYRKVDIESLNGNIVEFTMWDKMAEIFGDADFRTMEQPVIIAVNSCRVSKNRDYQLTATSATWFYLNPKIPEAEQAREQYRANHAITPPLRIYKTPYEDIEKEKFRNRFPLKTLLNQNPERYNGVQFTAEATITSIDIRKNWFYMACNECATKVKENGGVYRCLNHGRQSQPCYRYNFRAFVTDQSATAPFTFFTPGADDVTGYSCSELIAQHKAADPQEIPPQIFEAEGQKNIFQFHFSTTSKTKEFILDRVFNKKRNTGSTDSSLTANPATPPTMLAITNQEDADHKKDAGTNTKSVKRSLFQDEPAESKKQKATADTSTKDHPKTKSSHTHQSS